MTNYFAKKNPFRELPEWVKWILTIVIIVTCPLWMPVAFIVAVVTRVKEEFFDSY